jgi:DNA polymerase I
MTMPVPKAFRKHARSLPHFLLCPDPSIYLSDNFVTLDFETKTTKKHEKAKKPSPSAFIENNDTVCVSWTVGPSGEKQFYRGGVFEHFDLIQRCYEADYIVMHNAKFDLQWLARAGLDLRKVLIADTMIGEYVLTGNLKAGKHGALRLDTLAKQYLQQEKKHFIDICMGHVCPSEMPASLLQERACDDTGMTRDIWVIMRERLDKSKLLPTFFTRCILTPVLADIEKNGVHLDKYRVIAEYRETKDKLDAIEKEIVVMMEGRNPRSPQQKAEFLYEVLKFKVPKKGKKEHRTTRMDDILTFKATTQKQKKYIELQQQFSKLNAAVSKNLAYFYGVVMESDDCLMYAQFNQTTTVTHRLSSSGIPTYFDIFKDEKSIQFQNMPRAYKKLVSSRREGWKVGEADGAQIEFRVAAFCGQDKVACQEIINRFDVHLFTASQLNHITIEEVSDDQRTNAKSRTFKPLYGGKFGTDEEMTYYAAFRDKYTSITAWQQRNEAICLQYKRMTTCTGLNFYFPSCRMVGDYNPDWPSICNYPVQSLATAEIIPIAVTYLWHVMKDMQAFLCNTVHDSVVFESPDEELEQMYDLCNWAFLDAVYEYLELVYGLQFNVPLGLGFAVGTHWGAKGSDCVIPERKVMRMPPYRMAGVDYSPLEKEAA